MLLGGLAVRFGPGLIATNRVVRNYTRLLDASFAGDLDRVAELCTERRVAAFPLRTAPEGGVVGLPRGINKNFQVWLEGDEVRLCPTNRVGPVYRFRYENGDWRFDGPAGILRPGGVFLPLPEGRSTEEIDEP
ncbi:MAG: hypothetical protein SFX72_04740 [Isosphaeraceae bacterium]|nr:hypothetical protein [Isosphaeraceae bacterium]